MEQITDIIHELIRYRRVSVEETLAFQTLKHDADLCPRFASKLSTLLESSKRYQSVAYDVQGFRDRGKDIVLRFGNEDSSRYNTFQIKSFHDIEKKDYLSKLKAQTFEVQQDYETQLDHHFIVICTDYERHLSQTRTICAEFSKSSWVTVIEPQYALSFLHLSSLQIDAAVQRFLRHDDRLYQSALDSLYTLVPLEILVLLCISTHTYNEKSRCMQFEDLMGLEILDTAMNSIPDVTRDYFFYDYIEEYGWDDDALDYLEEDLGRSKRERLIDVLFVLDGNGIELSAQTDTIIFKQEQFCALEALMLEAQVRFDFDKVQVVRFLYDTLEINKMYEIEFQEDQND